MRPSSLNSHIVRMDQDVYTDYYLDQIGNGLNGIGSVYKRRTYQNGRGIGSLFSGIMKSLKPIFSSTVKAVGKQSLKTGRAIFKSRGKQTFKEALKENGKRMLSALAEKGAEQIEKFNSMNNIGDMNTMETQEGNGIDMNFGPVHKKGFKRMSTLKSRQSSKRSKRVKKKNNSNKTRSTKSTDIFSQ